jgi:dienelactone hydrolase
MRLLIAAVLLFLAGPAQASLKAGTFEYRHGETVLSGYLALDASVSGQRPGILVIHDWMGVGPFVQGIADRLAGLGYVVLAADIYGQGVRPKDATEAAALSGKWRADRGALRDRARAGLDALRALPEVDQARTAVTGYCFGGGTALELARSGAPVAGSVSFHGFLDTPDRSLARGIAGKLLVLQGSDDPVAPPDQRLAFEDEMRASAVDWQFVLYGGAVHAFTNPAAGSDPSKGSAYDEKADRRSWEAMKAFLTEIFRQGPVKK